MSWSFGFPISSVTDVLVIDCDSTDRFGEESVFAPLRPASSRHANPTVAANATSAIATIRTLNMLVPQLLRLLIRHSGRLPEDVSFSFCPGPLLPWSLLLFRCRSKIPAGMSSSQIDT